MSMLERARPELVAFAPYASARRAGFDARVRLDANESPWDSADDGCTDAGLNRYPQPQPDALRARLAALYGVDAASLWLGRGSDEAIDLLLRAFCRAGRDNVVAFAPTFGMYRVGAALQGAAFRTLALSADDGFALDTDHLLALADDDTKLVIVCSPNNPSGTLYHGDALERLARALDGRALLLVDEAYVEFAGVASASALLARHSNVAVLRTLSKAHALAGARVGALLAHPEVVDLVARIAAPYPLPSGSVRAASAALEPATLARTRARIATLVAERERIAVALAVAGGVRTVWPSAGNFLLVRFADAREAFARLLGAGILVRDFSAQPGLANCLRITIGRPDENDALLAALGGARR
ncbi:histidinol-phosphate transaminase [Dokdonella fugitiva]|uniref:Histidinol-phosphate aminotransferase n=1 Tax=Dokdonella fugitiva TaxID=328517 RepID=A0A4R2I412_9GAMM|nr:histidinol-phosphate transaminase [Dokdonella fugitiva]TCO38844.1 histidinol-phosphate aminotransferase [Dokdonella fugitiva]